MHSVAKDPKQFCYFTYSISCRSVQGPRIHVGLVGNYACRAFTFQYHGQNSEHDAVGVDMLCVLPSNRRLALTVKPFLSAKHECDPHRHQNAQLPLESARESRSAPARLQRRVHEAFCSQAAVKHLILLPRLGFAHVKISFIRGLASDFEDAECRRHPQTVPCASPGDLLQLHRLQHAASPICSDRGSTQATVESSDRPTGHAERAAADISSLPSSSCQNDPGIAAHCDIMRASGWDNWHRRRIRGACEAVGPLCCRSVHEQLVKCLQNAPSVPDERALLSGALPRVCRSALDSILHREYFADPLRFTQDTQRKFLQASTTFDVQSIAIGMWCHASESLGV